MNLYGNLDVVETIATDFYFGITEIVAKCRINEQWDRYDRTRRDLWNYEMRHITQQGIMLN